MFAENIIVKNSFQLDSSNSWCLRMLPDLSEFIMPLGWNWKIILTQNLLESCFYSLFKAINEKISVPATWIRLHWENLTTARKSKFRSFADLLAKNCARERGLGILADLKGFRSRRRFLFDLTQFAHIPSSGLIEWLFNTGFYFFLLIT